MMLTEEEAIDKVNPFVTHDFSLPGSVRQSGGYDDFTEIRSEPGIQKPKRSVYCEYGLCAESTSDCYLDRPLIPYRNIDTGFTKQKKRGIIEKVKVGVSNHPEFSMIGGGLIITSIIVMIYYTRR
jgi:hypothetical protein